MNKDVFPSGERMVLVTMACALVSMLLAIVVGAIGALSYVPGIGRVMAGAGFTLAQLRPLHTTFASAWIYLGCVACIYSYLHHRFGPPTPAERLRFRIHMVLWGLAGLGGLLTLALGVTSGREYLGMHPALSVPVLAGWLVFLYTMLRRVLPTFWAQPVYVYMWTAGALYFVYTFIEGHAHLLSPVAEHPVADLQIQWKSCGTLVAAFNQMVYGSLMYIGERTTGDRRVGQSHTAFALFGVGLLNSFTNYAHHTYHLPQSHAIKWFAFGVSMIEIILLWNLLREIVAKMKGRRPLHTPFSTPTRFFALAKGWNAFLLPLALLISVPPLNSVIHGTHVVMAHAMGSELAIDSYILLGAFAWLFAQIFPKRETLLYVINGPHVERAVGLLNGGLALLVGTLLLGGLTVGVTRYLGQPLPEFMQGFPVVFVVTGFVVGYALVRLILCWVPLFRDPMPNKLFRNDPRWDALVGPEPDVRS